MILAVAIIFSAYFIYNSYYKKDVNEVTTFEIIKHNSSDYDPFDSRLYTKTYVNNSIVTNITKIYIKNAEYKLYDVLLFDYIAYNYTYEKININTYEGYKFNKNIKTVIILNIEDIIIIGASNIDAYLESLIRKEI